MFRHCNCVLVFLNALTFTLSIAIIVGVRNFQTYPYSGCEGHVQQAVLGIGLFLLVLSLIGFIGSCCRIMCLHWLYLWMMLAFIAGLLSLTSWGLVAIYKGGGGIAPQKGQDEYQVEHFSDYLRSQVLNKDTWTIQRSYLVDHKTCANLDKMISNMPDTGYKKNFPLQWGCCKPPLQCGYEQKNATFWTVPPLKGLASDDRDCITYSNHQDTLCFDCESCKVGFLTYLRIVLRTLVCFNTVISLFLMTVFSIACCAFRSNRKADAYMRRREEMVQKASDSQT